MVFFHRSKDTLLIFAVLKKAGGCSAGIRTRTDHAEDVELVVASFFLIHAYDAATRFVDVVAVALVENGFERVPGHRDNDFGVFGPKHWRHSLSNKQRNSLEARGRSFAAENDG